MAFEAFTPGTFGRNSVPGEWVSIGKGGSIGVSRDAANRINKTTKVLALYDRDANKMGFRSAQNGFSGYVLQKAGKAYFLACGAFVKHVFGAKPQHALRYRATWNAKEGLLEVDLNQEPMK